MISDIQFTLVTKASALEELVKKYNTVEQAEFYIRHLGQDFEKYQQENEDYQRAKGEILSYLKALGRVNLLDRNYLPNYIFSKDSIVIVLGPDGLVANTMKYLDKQIIIGVNPNPQNYDGILLPFKANELQKIIPEILRGKRKIREITMAKASLNDGQELYAVNDLFIGAKSHSSARYSLHYQGKAEHQSSSGIIISTGLGSTGWLKSVIKGAFAVVEQLNPNIEKPENSKVAADLEQQGILNNLNWESEKLIFSVREPFPSINTQISQVFGEINPQNQLQIISNMAENGVIFSDGIESDFLTFSSGMTASISVAKRKGHLYI